MATISSITSTSLLSSDNKKTASIKARSCDSPIQQKLFYKPGVIEETEEYEDDTYDNNRILLTANDSPLLINRTIQQQQQQAIIIPKTPSLNRISTYNSLSHFSTRPESR